MNEHLNFALRGLAATTGLLLCTGGLLRAADITIGRLPTGESYVENHVIIALKADFARSLSPTGLNRRPVDTSALLTPLLLANAAVCASHTAVERWLQGQPLPSGLEPGDGSVPLISRILCVNIPAGIGILDLLEALRATGYVDWADVIRLYEPSQIPNDPGYSNQWALPFIGAEAAWEVAPADTTVDIAIVDSGVDLDHPDLAGVISYQRGFGSNRSGDAPRDGRSLANHGTHVAGIAAAIRNNNLGVAGVAQARLMAMGCAQWDPYDNQYKISFAEFAMLDAMANGAEIINCSFNQADSLCTTMQAVLSIAQQRGVLVVVSAGNASRDVGGIQWDQHEHPMIVSNTDMNDNLNPSSNFGSAIDIAAPGTTILSTVVGGGTDFMSGTSMAAPLVAGSAALVWSMNPRLTGSEGVRHLLYRMVTDIGMPGADVFYGRGRLRLAAEFLRPLKGATVFVGSSPGNYTADGYYERPYRSLAEALERVAPGGTVVLNGGLSDQGSYTYSATRINQAVRLTAFPDRPVLIGR